MDPVHQVRCLRAIIQPRAARMAFSESKQLAMLRTHLESRHYTLRRGEIDAMRERLQSLMPITREFAFANLHLAIFYSELMDEFHVRGRLGLPGRVLLTGEHDSILLPSYDLCIEKLVRKAEIDHKRRNEGGRFRNIKAAPPDLENQDARLTEAFAQGDFWGFWSTLKELQPVVVGRIRRWLAGRVGLETRLLDALVMDDLVDEVILTALSRYESRPRAMFLDAWLGILVDPAMRNMLRRPRESNEAVGYERSLREIQTGRIPLGEKLGGSSPGNAVRWPRNRHHDTNMLSENVRRHRMRG